MSGKEPQSAAGDDALLSTCGEVPAKPAEGYLSSSTDHNATWGWYASFDGGEIYTIGPEDTRDAIIAEAEADGSGECEVLDDEGHNTGQWEHRFTIMEAKKNPVDIAGHFDAERFLDDANESISENHGDPDDGASDMLAPVTPDMTADLETRVRATIRAWQTAHNLVITPWIFSETRHEEEITVPSVNTYPPESPTQ